MQSAMRTPRARALLASLLVVMMSSASLDPGPAAAQEPPEDDSAPPEDRAVYLPGLQSIGVQPSPQIDASFPIYGRIRSSCNNNFGEPRGGGRTHMGVDCFAPRGTPVAATEDGTIRYATVGGPFSCATGGDISGNRISVRGNSGYIYYYGHLDEIWVGEGQPVAKGQLIGRLGSTGNASCSGPHLHFELKYGETGDPFDPYPWMAPWGRVTVNNFGWASTELIGAGVWFAAGLGRADVFVLDGSRTVRQRAWNGGLGPWLTVGGQATSDPDMAAPNRDSLPYAFVRGTDASIWQLYYNGSGWGGVNLGGMCTSGPAAAYSGPTRLDLFCRGWDLALYQRVWTASGGWGAWTKVGGYATSDPDVVWPGPGYPVEVLARGSDGAAHLLSRTSSGWRGESLGGNCTSGVTGAYSGPDRLDVFCRGNDIALWYKTWLRGSGWSGWQRIPSQISSDPEAVSWGLGTVAEVFARGVDDQIHQFYWNGSTWVEQIWGQP